MAISLDAAQDVGDGFRVNIAYNVSNTDTKRTFAPYTFADECNARNVWPTLGQAAPLGVKISSDYTYI